MNNKNLSHYKHLPSLDPYWKRSILSVLRRFNHQFYVYGSRARGDNQKYSDLDLVTFQNFSSPYEKKKVESLLLNLDDVPILVSVTCWDQLSSDFKKEVKRDLIPFEL